MLLRLCPGGQAKHRWYMTNGNGKFDLDSTLVRKLAKLLQETGLSEIEYAEGDKRIRCASQVTTSVPHPAPIVAPPAAAAAVEAKPPAVAGTPVASPMV